MVLTGLTFLFIPALFSLPRVTSLYFLFQMSLVVVELLKITPCFTQSSQELKTNVKFTKFLCKWVSQLMLWMFMRTIQTILNTTDADVIMSVRFYIGFNWLSTVQISTNFAWDTYLYRSGQFEGFMHRGTQCLRVAWEADTCLKTWWTFWMCIWKGRKTITFFSIELLSGIIYLLKTEIV